MGDKFGVDPAPDRELEDQGAADRAGVSDAPPEWVGLLLDRLVTALRPDTGAGSGDTTAPAPGLEDPAERLFGSVQAWHRVARADADP